MVALRSVMLARTKMRWRRKARTMDTSRVLMRTVVKEKPKSLMKAAAR